MCPHPHVRVLHSRQSRAARVREHPRLGLSGAKLPSGLQLPRRGCRREAERGVVAWCLKLYRFNSNGPGIRQRLDHSVAPFDLLKGHIGKQCAMPLLRKRTLVQQCRQTLGDPGSMTGCVNTGRLFVPYLGSIRGWLQCASQIQHRGPNPHQGERLHRQLDPHAF